MNPEEPKQTTEPSQNQSPELSPQATDQGVPAAFAPLASEQPKPKRTFGQKLKRLFKSRAFWLWCIALLVVAGVAAWFVQPARWWLVNLAGQHNVLSISTITPGIGSKARASQLKNVTVTVNGKEYRTNSQGQLHVPNVPYGNVSIAAAKVGYQTVTDGALLDFDPFFHKLGGAAQDEAARTIQLSMVATGISTSFKVVDSLSGQPVTAGQFTIGDVVAKPDDQGVVSLKVPGELGSKVTVTPGFGGSYVDRAFDITLGDSSQQVSVVPGGKHYFIGGNGGVLTVYSCDLDGSDVQPIVTGTGQETAAAAFAVSPDGKYGVLSSSRDGAYDARRGLLQRVYVVDLTTKQITRVDEGTSVTFADWSGDTLVYTRKAYDPNNNNYPTTLRSVNVSTARVYNFETADTINVSTVAFDKVVYQRWVNSGADASNSPQLREAPVNGTNVQTLGDQVDSSSYIQQSFDRVDFKTDQDQAWHEFNLNTGALGTITQPGGDSTTQYLATASPDGSQRLLVQQIGGQYALVLKNAGNGSTRQLYGGSGLAGPIRWVGSVVVFRVTGGAGAADYAISLGGGEPHQVTSVTPTVDAPGMAGTQRFAFY